MVSMPSLRSSSARPVRTPFKDATLCCSGLADSIRGADADKGRPFPKKSRQEEEASRLYANLGYGAVCFLLSTVYCFEHSNLASIVKQAARFEDGGNFAQRLQRPLFAGGEVVKPAVGDINAQLVARADFFAQALRAFERDQVAAVDGIAEEDACIELGHDGFDSRRIQGNRRMLAR